MYRKISLVRALLIELTKYLLKSITISMNNRARLTYSLMVLCGGASYGVLASVVKLAYNQDLNFEELVSTQAVFASICFLLAWAHNLARGRRRRRISWQGRLKLILMGLITSGTTTFYYLSLSFIPATIAITLLFQFTWIGLIFELVSTRKRPTNAALIAAGIIFIGTLFASGAIGEGNLLSLSPIGVICGLLSALSCASFMFLSGKVEADLPVTQRGLWACMGYLCTGIALCPHYLSLDIVGSGLASFGLLLGPLGFFLPMILFGIGCKYLSPGLSAIMASSELPISILCSLFILHESLSAAQSVGILFILVGIVVAEIPGIRNRKNILS